MNNSLSMEEYTDTFAEKPHDPTLTLRERDSKLVSLLESIDAILGTREWALLREEVFEPLLGSIEKQIQSEADRPDISLNAIYRLQGERKTARKIDLQLLRNQYHAELLNIRKQLGN